MTDTETSTPSVESVREGSPPANGSGSEKTAYCAQCHRRHRISAWPEGHPRGTQEAATIAGAQSAEDLGGQVRDQMGKKGKKSATDKKLDAAELAARRIAAIRLGRKLASAPYSIAVMVTAEPEWRTAVTDEEITDIAEAWADFAEAWGVHATGKVIAAIALALAYGTTTGKVYARVKAKELPDWPSGAKHETKS